MDGAVGNRHARAGWRCARALGEQDLAGILIHHHPTPPARRAVFRKAKRNPVSALGLRDDDGKRRGSGESAARNFQRLINRDRLRSGWRWRNLPRHLRRFGCGQFVQQGIGGSFKAHHDAGDGQRQQEQQGKDSDRVVQIEPEASSAGAPLHGDALQRPPQKKSGEQQEQHGHARPTHDLLAGIALVLPAQADVELVNVVQELRLILTDAENLSSVWVQVDGAALVQGDKARELRRGRRKVSLDAFARENPGHNRADLREGECALSDGSNVGQLAVQEAVYLRLESHDASGDPHEDHKQRRHQRQVEMQVEDQFAHMLRAIRWD